MDKCFICRTRATHRFNDCVSATCSCQCVSQIYTFPKNELAEEVPDDSPKFLKINNVEIKKLPDLAKEVSRLAKIDKHEWIKTKIDRRFKSKRYGNNYN
jgi:hypothetical protein